MIITHGIISLHIRSYVRDWSVIAQARFLAWTVNFGPNFPCKAPFWNFRPESPPPILENFRLWDVPKFTLEYPPPHHFGKLQIWDDQSLLRNTPHFGNLQIWDDQSLLQNIPPILENFRFEITKVYVPEYPPSFRKYFRIWEWPKFTPKYPSPPISGNAGDRMWRLICNPQGYHSIEE